MRAWHQSRHLDQELTLTAREQAPGNGRPEIHHSALGVQHVSQVYVARLEELGAQVSMAGVGAAWQNGCAERLVHTI